MLLYCLIENIGILNDLIYILVLAVVVTIHEFGHYTFARLIHVKVLRVQLFFFTWYTFKPKPSMTEGLSWRDTEYSIGFLPFGGYTSYAVSPYSTVGDGSYYYNSKRAWQRFLTSIAGVLFNLLTALVIYAIIISMSDMSSSTGFMHELSAAFEFVGITVMNMFSNILGMFGIQGGSFSISLDNYMLIQSFVNTASEYPILMYIADLSCVLAIINILPIPPLDGGQALFDLYEMFTGRQPGEKFKRVAVWVGSIIFILVFWILPIIRRAL